MRSRCPKTLLPIDILITKAGKSPPTLLCQFSDQSFLPLLPFPFRELAEGIPANINHCLKDGFRLIVKIFQLANNFNGQNHVFGMLVYIVQGLVSTPLIQTQIDLAIEQSNTF